MHLTLIAVGQSMPKWIQTGFEDYRKRLPPEFSLQLIEIETSKQHKHGSVPRIFLEEGNKMLAAIPKNSRVIALDVKGELWDTATLAKRFQIWQSDGRPASFLIGGPEGLAPSCLAKADHKWSLSPLTFPHALVRVIVAEQLYRAYTVIKGHPYHRE